MFHPITDELSCYPLETPISCRESPDDPGAVLSKHRPIRVSVLTKDQQLIERIDQQLSSEDQELSRVDTIADAERIANAHQCDVTIVDLSVGEAWPDTVFGIFENRADEIPLIILCEKTDEVSTYRKRARCGIDILPTKAVDDRRFYSALQAAVLRSDMALNGSSPASP